MTQRTDKHPDWWPPVLWHVRDHNFLSGSEVIVSEISNGDSPDGLRDCYLAFAPADVAQNICSALPPRFHYLGSGISLGDEQGRIEPLAARWEGGLNHSVQVPSIGFVRAFGLVPRPVDVDDNPIIRWDDLAKPLHDVVRGELVSVYDCPKYTPARILVKKDYLLEYADRTNQAIIALAYESCSGPNEDENGHPYDESDFGDFIMPGRMVGLRPAYNDPNRIEAEYWGAALVHLPATAGCVDGDSIPPLLWPGIEEEVTPDSARRLGMKKVLVSDEVLDAYEEHPDLFTVHPDSGGVSYGNQWSVSNCHRVDRDLIELELKKLYEGANKKTILHWHRHSVSDQRLAANIPNVATRAKRLVDAVLDLGDALSHLETRTIGSGRSGSDYLTIDRETLARTWWYDDDFIRPITRRYGLDLGRAGFLQRCQDLAKLAVELPEMPLRNMLRAWKCPAEMIEASPGKPLRSLKLLNNICHVLRVSQDTGLELPDDVAAIWERYQEQVRELPKGEHLPSPVGSLFRLYDMRVMAAHRGLDRTELYRLAGTSAAATVAGWGEVLDKLIDSLASDIDELATVIKGS